MGEVYRARDTRLARDVAIKVLPASFASDADRLRRFEQEARATGMLNHPNILAVYDVGTHEGAPYLVTELLEGQTLREELPVPRRKAFDYARQITAGLAAAHSKGITHRDLKPENLFVTTDGRIKILDFGLAKLEVPAADSELTRTDATTPGMALGTVGYMSPEQARGKTADHRSDIFSFGAILYEMLSGTRAFHRDSTMDTMSAILKEDPPPLADSALEGVVRRCIEKTPEQRFQSASDLGFAIASMSGSSILPAQPSGTVRVKRMPVATSTVAIAAALLVAIGAAAGIWWQARQDAAAPTWKGEQLTGTGIVYGPRVSPDGKTLAFVAMEGVQSQVAVMHPGSTNWTVLTHEKGRGEIDTVSWSHDGAKIYFARRTGIYSVPALGGDERLVVEQAMAAEALPDGSLLFARLNANRVYQLHRFWPDTGRLQALDVEIIPRIRAFPDGREAVFIGRALNAPKADYELVIFDLATSKLRIRALPKDVHIASPTLAPSPGGKSIIALVRAGDLLQIADIARDGVSKPRALFSLSSPIWFLDAASDGAIYADQVERPFDVLRFPSAGGIPERVVQAARGNYALPLADGRIAFEATIANRNTILISQPGKNPVPLVETEEETSGPITLVGKDLIALKMGKPGENYKSRVVTLVSIADGRIVRNIEQTRGIGMSAMAASPDGKTIYYVAESKLWSVSPEGGEPKKLGFGDAVAVNPNGKDLVVTRAENNVVHFYRISLTGGPETQIPFSTNLVPNSSLAASAIRADGKIAITILQPDSWWDEPAILDPATGKVEKLNVPYSGDAFATAWTSDGRMIAQGLPIQGSIWRFKK